jgi:hypothetical protein
MTEPKPITWTETAQPEPVVRTFLLSVQERGRYLRNATPADLSRSVAALTPEQRSEYEAAGGATGLDADRLRTIIDEGFGLQPVAPDGELLTLLERCLAERSRRENAVWEKVEKAEKERDEARSQVDSLRDQLGSSQSALAEYAEWKRVWERQMAELRAELDRVRPVVEAARCVSDAADRSMTSGSLGKPIAALQLSLAELEEADALSTSPPKSAADLAAEHGFKPHGRPLDVALRGHGSAPAPKPEETAWLIEDLRPPDPMYAAVNEHGMWYGEWDINNPAVVRFANKSSAAAVMRAVKRRDDGYAPSGFHHLQEAREHVWVPYTPPATDAKGGADG